MTEKFSKFLNLNDVLKRDVEPEIVWNCEFVEYIKDTVNWKNLSSSKKINTEIVEKFPDKIHWQVLSKNTHFEWNTNLIRKFQNKIDWYYFSSNFQMESLYRTHVCFLLEEFIDKFNWNQLCSNTNILFNKIFHYHNSDNLKNYKHKFDWFELSQNLSFPWSQHLLEENMENIDWNTIVLNKCIYSNKEFILKFHKKFNWSGHYQKSQHTHTYYPANISTIPDVDIPIEVLKCHYKEWKKSLSFDSWAEKERGESEWSNYSTSNCYISVEIMREFDEHLGFYGIFNNKNFLWTKEKIEYCKNKDGFTKVFHNNFCQSYILEQLFTNDKERKKNEG